MQSGDSDDESGADTQLERATEKLRELVLAGTFPVEVKLAETRVADLLAVSRTPARLAMAALEQDGLLVRMPRRGFRVRSFSLDEVVEAIEVRGEIEAVAARLAAERGLSDESRVRMRACIDAAQALMANGVATAAQRREWCVMNAQFHDALVASCGVRPLRAAWAKVNLVPLAAPRDIMFNVEDQSLSRRQLEATHEDHVRILDAIAAQSSTRAAALVREHAYRSGENKRRNFSEAKNFLETKARRLVIETLGIALVRAD